MMTIEQDRQQEQQWQKAGKWTTRRWKSNNRNNTDNRKQCRQEQQEREQALEKLKLGEREQEEQEKEGEKKSSENSQQEEGKKQHAAIACNCRILSTIYPLFPTVKKEIETITVTPSNGQTNNCWCVDNWTHSSSQHIRAGGPTSAAVGPLSYCLQLVASW